MHIRKAVSADLNALVQFNQAMALETENKQLDNACLTAGVRAVLDSQDKGFYLVAEVAGEIVGSLMVTFEWSDWRNGTFWWVQSVYIVPEHRRKGIYSALYREVQTLSEDQPNVCGYRLYVEKDNLTAQRTYQALGMEETHYLMFEASKSN
ncbi:GNAT family N-acetyltransferase [Aestuariibacter halophilus]|uniref:GNAT family N-acetyltransferase n=1 Tax=Fluctibacter halophilus TaxID=226011 RepID=A0ABS8G3N5_9ALTE|nr:GNAT family N-acetyltransferase [Aestuariibacter halophilus]MCC2615202.1 GNAT family N-acetyltransferase [Aestuariibacter halophilus]